MDFTIDLVLDTTTRENLKWWGGGGYPPQINKKMVLIGKLASILDFSGSPHFQFSLVF